MNHIQILSGTLKFTVDNPSWVILLEMQTFKASFQNVWTSFFKWTQNWQIRCKYQTVDMDSTYHALAGCLITYRICTTGRRLHFLQCCGISLQGPQINKKLSWIFLFLFQSYLKKLIERPSHTNLKLKFTAACQACQANIEKYLASSFLYYPIVHHSLSPTHAHRHTVYTCMHTRVRAFTHPHTTPNSMSATCHSSRNTQISIPHLSIWHQRSTRQVNVYWEPDYESWKGRTTSRTPTKRNRPSCSITNKVYNARDKILMLLAGGKSLRL